jgi:hypothetical protein
MSEVAELHEPFIDFLRDKGLLYIHADPTRKSTIQKGHPDFTVFLSGNRCVLIEMKEKTKGHLSADQKKRISSLAFAGIYVHVCTDLATAKTAVLEAMSGHHREVVAQSEQLTRYGNALYRETPNGLEKVRTAL